MGVGDVVVIKFTFAISSPDEFLLKFRKGAQPPPNFWPISATAEHLFLGSWVPIEHKIAWAEAYTSIPSGILMHPAVCPQQKWAENWAEDSTPFFGRGAGSPSSTMWPVPRPTSMPSAILIHPAIWPQQIWAQNWGLCPFGGRKH